MRTGVVKARRGVSLAAAVLAAPVLAGCSTSAGSKPGATSNGSTTPTTTSAAIGPDARTLAALPTASFKAQAGSVRFIVAGRGEGDKHLGRFQLTGKNLVIQTVCKGEEPLTIVGLGSQGPCEDYPGVITTKPAHSGWFTFTVQAPPATKWAVYITQAR